jgi:hypothetical protein
MRFIPAVQALIASSLVVWSAFVSIDAMFRRPGLLGLALPSTLVVDGVSWHRVTRLPIGPVLANLPANVRGVELVEVASYRRPLSGDQIVAKLYSSVSSGAYVPWPPFPACKELVQPRQPKLLVLPSYSVEAPLGWFFAMSGLNSHSCVVTTPPKRPPF